MTRQAHQRPLRPEPPAGSVARAPSERAKAATFILLALVSAAGFVVAQRLKHAPSVVEKVRSARRFSPNGDGRKDVAPVSFRLPAAKKATVSIVDAEGAAVRTLARDRRFGRGRHAFSWDGRTETGKIARDGAYRVRIELPEEGRSITARGKIHLDTRPPRARIVTVAPPVIAPGATGAAWIMGR